MKIIKLLLLLAVASSCSKKEGDLEISLLTNEMVYVGNVNFRDVKDTTDYYTDEVYDSISRNILRYKLKNNSDKKYFVVLNEDVVDEVENDKALNYSSEKKIGLKNSFSLNLYKGEDILEGNSTLVMGSFEGESLKNSPLSKQMYIDSLFVANTQKRKIYGERKANAYDRDVLLHSFVIFPGETKYFTSIVNLPYRKDGVYWVSAIDKDKPDSASLTLVNKEVFTKQHLSEDQKNEIQENGYVIFDGVIRSNKVPLKSVNMPK